MSDSVSMDIELKKTFDDFAKATSQTLDSVQHGCDESAAKWADESGKQLEKLNDLNSKIDEQAKVIKSLETLAARPRAQTEKDFCQKDAMVDLNVFIRKSAYDANYKLESNSKMYDRALGFYKKYLPHSTNEKGEFLITKDVLESILPDGGYFTLPPQYLDRRITRVFETSPVRQVANVMTVSKEQIKMVIDDDQVTNLTTGGEQTPITKSTTPQIGLTTFSAAQISAELYVSDYMIQDAAFDIGQWIINKGSDKIARQQNTAFIKGSGADEARGILNYGKWGGVATAIGNDDAYTKDALQYILSGDNAALTFDGIVNLQNSLLENYQNNAVYMMHRTTWGAVLRLKDDEGRPLYQMANLLRDGADNLVLWGKRVIFASDLVGPQNATGQYNQGDAPIIYGDFKDGYVVMDRIGMNILRDMYTQASNNIIRYLMKTRYTGGLTSYQSLKVLEIGASA